MIPGTASLLVKPSDVEALLISPSQLSVCKFSLHVIFTQNALFFVNKNETNDHTQKFI